MKRTIYLMLLVIFACSDDEVPDINDPIETSLISINSTDNLDPNHHNWVIISNDMGEILASGELKKDSTFFTSEEAGEFINVTFLNFNGNILQLKTFTQVMLNDVWYIRDNSRINYSEANQNAQININNISIDSKNNFFFYSVSNAHGSIFASAGLGNTDLDIGISINEEEPKDILLVINDGILDPTYRWFTEELFNAGTIDLDFQTDFTQMDQVLEFSFSNIISTYMDITAYDLGNLSSFRPLDGYAQFELFHSGEESTYQYKAGYLEGYDYYQTNWSGTISGRGLSYKKFGGPPEAFGEELFQGDFEMNNTEYDAFQFSVTGDFDVAEGLWTSEDRNLAWVIYYPIENSTNVVLSDLPAEIESQYPELTLSNLEFVKGTFTRMIDNEGYSSYIDYHYNNELGNMVTEQYSISRGPN